VTAPGTLKLEIITEQTSEPDDFDLGLGEWQTIVPPADSFPFESARALTFSSKESPVTFRVSAPSLSSDLSLKLDAVAARLKILGVGLDAVDARVGMTLRLAAGGAGISFDSDGRLAAERQLAGWIRRMRAMDMASFAAATDGQDGGRVHAYLGYLFRRLSNFILIETQVADQTAASTRVSFSGEFVSVIPPASRTEEWQFHARTVDAALRQQRILLRIVLLTLGQAGKLAVAVGTGQWLVALPAVWRFLKTVMEETQRQKLVA